MLIKLSKEELEEIIARMSQAEHELRGIPGDDWHLFDIVMSKLTSCRDKLE